MSKETPCNYCGMVTGDHPECVIESLREEIAGLKETNRRLNRRCQEAESAMMEWKEISDLTKEQRTGRFCPALMRYALTKAGLENERLKEEVNEREQVLWRMGGIHEDELPELDSDEFAMLFNVSKVDGVRIYPKLAVEALKGGK